MLELPVLSFACRLPGASTPDAFWDLLVQGREAIGPIPPDRPGYFQLALPHPPALRGAFLDSPYLLDAAHFQLRDPAWVDPQQRLLLELGEELFARAGLGQEQRRGRRVGVFLGVTSLNHQEWLYQRYHAQAAIPPSAATGGLGQLVAGRLAGHLGLEGPVVVLDTACSSTLVALHLARRALEAHDCELAVVGGIQLNLTGAHFYLLGSTGAISPTGHCRPFAENADGFVMGEGAGLFLLGPAEPGWPILGLIRGSAVNNDGPSRQPMLPRGAGQEAVMRQAWQEAGLEPKTASFVEAHGTGTPVGDAVEARSLIHFFPKGHRLLGAVKGNLGHLLAASAVPALAKTLLALARDSVPPSLHQDHPRSLGLPEAGFELHDRPRAWPAQPRAALNSFGFGGTNAHAILDPAPANRVFCLDWTPPSQPQLHRLPLLPPAPPPQATSPQLQRAVQTWELLEGWDKPDFPKESAPHVTLCGPSRPALLALRQLLEAQGLTASLADDPQETRLPPAPSSATGSRQVGQDLETAQPPHRTLLVWLTDGTPSHSLRDWENALRADIFPLRRLLAARQSSSDGAPFWVVTRGAYASQLASSPLQAVATGLGMATPGVLTLDLPDDSPGSLASAARLLARTDALQAALEGRPRPLRWVEGGLLVRTSRPLTPPVGARPSPDAPCNTLNNHDISPNNRPSVWVILGGTGQLGQAAARALAAPGRTLVLVARHPERLPAQTRQDLANAGAQVKLLEADATSSAGAARIVETVEGLGTWAGLVHAMGGVEAGSLSGVPESAARDMWESRLKPLWLLEKLSQIHGLRPERWILCSSLSAWRPDLQGGLADYVAGHLALEAYGNRLRLAGHSVQLLAWGPWEGALTAHPGLPASLARQGLACITPDQGREAWQEALELPAKNLLIWQSVAQTLPEVQAPEPTPRPEGHTSSNHLTPPQPQEPPAGQPTSSLPTASQPTSSLPTASQPTSSLPTASLPTASQPNSSLPASSQPTSSQPTSGLPPLPGPSAASPATPGTSVAQETAQEGHSPNSAGQVAPYDTTSEEHFLSRILDTVAQALGQETRQLDPETPFLSLGLDSLTALDVARRLREELGVPLPLTLLLEHPSPKAVARALAAQASSPLPDSQTVLAFPLSPVQQAFELQQRLYPDTPCFSLIRLTLAGQLEAPRLAEGLAQLRRLHPMLQVRLVRDGQLVEQRLDGLAPHLELAPPTDDPTLLETEVASRPFDLAAGALVRVVLASDLSGTRQHLVVCGHHAITDGWSQQLLALNLLLGYHYGMEVIPPPVLHFSECVAPPSALETHLEHWRRVLQPLGPAPAMPLPGERPQVTSGRPGLKVCSLDAPTTRVLTRRSRELGVTLFHLCASVFLQLLRRWTGEDAPEIWVARANRKGLPEGVDRVFGCFADTLPLRLNIDPSETLAELAPRVRDFWKAAEQHASPSSMAISRLRPESQHRRIGFSFARLPVPNLADSPLKVLEACGRTASAGTRLSVVAWELDGALSFSFNYFEDAFDEAAVTSLAEALASALHQAGGEPRQHPPHGSLSLRGRLEESLQTHAPELAVDDGQRRMTYAQLEEASREVMSTLRAARVGKLVALQACPSVEAVVALVGILRSGRGWLPLEPALPKARRVLQLAMAGMPRVLVADRQGMALEPMDSGPLSRLLESGAEPGPVSLSDHDPLYILFTSGSTGTPKAVPICSPSLISYLTAMQATFGYRPGDRCLQASSLAFDASIRQILGPLLAGACVVPAGPETARDPAALLRLVDQLGVTVWSSVPGLLNRILEVQERAPVALSKLRWVKVGGEVLSPALVRRYFAQCKAPLVNLYGPTEATINASWHILRGPETGDRVPIGRPIPGMVLEIRHADGTLCAPGEAGELWIGGPGLSPGYLGDAEQTRQAFVETSAGRRYRSGDRCLKDEKGDYYYLGRQDGQVKIRGYRVEPGELEAVLTSLPGVNQAAVIATESVSGWELNAFVEGQTSPRSVRETLALRLPPWLLPARLEVGTLPRLPNGKVDRAALLAMADRPQLPMDTPRPEPAEKGLERLRQTVEDAWRATLGTPDVQDSDDFFHQGGDSVKMLALFARLERQISPLPAPALLFHQRRFLDFVEALWREGARWRSDMDRLLQPAPAPPDLLPLSPAQQGFVLMRELGRPAHWLSRIRVRGPLEPARLQTALEAVLRRHPMLGTALVRTPAGLRQHLSRELRPTIRWEQCGLDEQRTTLQRLTEDELARPIHLEQAPVWRFTVLQVGQDLSYWLLAADHFLGDATSAAFIARDLLLAYDQPELLPPLAALDLATALEEPTDPDGRKALWWKEKLAGILPDVHTSRPAGARHQRQLSLSGEVLEQVQKRARDSGVTLAAYLIWAWSQTLLEGLGQPDGLIGVAISGRERPLSGLKEAVGPFALSLPLRTRHQETPRQVAETLAGIQASLLSARQIALATGLPVSQIAASRFLISVRDGLDSVPQGILRVEEGETVQPPLIEVSELQLFARSDSGRLVLRLEGGLPEEALENRLSRLFELLGVQHMPAALTLPGVHLEAPLTPVRNAAEGAMPSSVLTSPPPGPRPASPLGELEPVDAALIAYLPPPSALREVLGEGFDALLKDESWRQWLFPGGGPRWLERLTTPVGSSGLLCLQRTADELAGRPSSLVAAEVAQAIQLAAHRGAKAVSLAGMLPAWTGYGLQVKPLLKPGSPRLTTGHATTVASVVETARAALRGRRVEGMTVGAVGLGSIGRAALYLLLAELGWPARVLLCERAGAVEALEETSRGLQALGYSGPVLPLPSSGMVPDEVYQADLLLLAVSGGRVIDPNRLRPGAVVVDDSFPAAFSLEAARKRMQEVGDVLLVGGGLLQVGGIEQQLEVSLLKGSAEELFRRRPGLPSCQAESLLLARRPSLPEVLGPVTLSQARAWAAALREEAWCGAPLHLGRWVV